MFIFLSLIFPLSLSSLCPLSSILSLPPSFLLSLSLYLSPLPLPLSFSLSLLPSHLSSKLLQASNVYRTFLGCIQVARPHTEVRGRTDHSTSKSEWVIGENCLRRTVVVLRREKSN